MKNIDPTTDLENLEPSSPEDIRLQQLLHLKQFEHPNAANMLKNRQTIMRKVRESSGDKKWSLENILEVNIPWFFAEPKYGIAALFVAFALLQFADINNKKERQPTTYATFDSTTPFQASILASTSSNKVQYLKPSTELKLFPTRNPIDNRSIKFVGRIEESPTSR